ncbi:hypothetical protein UF75_0491 [Desulfosporosinus sp. I2]|nr:hypothetical protein UF75_0491 [Desulfosporosinus sp. I2]
MGSVDKSAPKDTSNSTCPKPVGKALLRQTPNSFSTGWHCPQAQDEEYLILGRGCGGKPFLMTNKWLSENKKVFNFVGIPGKMVP